MITKLKRSFISAIQTQEKGLLTTTKKILYCLTYGNIS